MSVCIGKFKYYKIFNILGNLMRVWEYQKLTFETFFDFKKEIKYTLTKDEKLKLIKKVLNSKNLKEKMVEEASKKFDNNFAFKANLVEMVLVLAIHLCLVFIDKFFCNFARRRWNYNLSLMQKQS